METTRSDYYAKLSGDVKDRYDAKIQKFHGIDPYAIKEKDLSSNLKDFPQISLLDIGNYVVHSTSAYTKKSFKAYKSTEAYRYFESGFVLSMGSKVNNNSAIVIGKVKHSQRMNEPPLKVWVLANMDGEIICAHCTCIAGLSETCSHVGAVCYAVSNIEESSEIKSVTDLLCKWNVPSFKEVSMSSMTNIHWTSRSLERPQEPSLESNFRSYCNSLTHFPDDIIDQFIGASHSDGDDTAVGTIVFSSEIRRRTNIKDEVFLACLYKDVYTNKSRCELVEIGQSISLKISDDTVNEISRSTELNSKCCLALTRGRVTGSNFKICCVGSINDPSITTINRVISPTRMFDFTPSVRYRIKNRKKAFDDYLRSAKHENFVHNKCGLVINSKLPYFACSPDALVSCSCHGKGCVEIKCLKMLESRASLDILTRKPNNILNKSGNEYTLEKKHEFFYQVQLQINLLELKYCDFTIWTPTSVSVLTIDADINFWMMAMEKAVTFHQQVIMPELLGKYYTKRSDSLTHNEENNEEKLQIIGLEIELMDSTEECIK